MFNKPYDLAVMVGIFVLVVVTIGFGVSSVISDFSLDTGSEDEFFSNIQYNATTSLGMQGAGEDASTSLTGEEGSTASEDVEENLIAQGYESLVNLGKVYNIAKSGATDATKYLSIDPIYWTVGLSVIIIIFAMIIYTWIRGR